jgi:hypothetical protein
VPVGGIFVIRLSERYVAHDLDPLFFGWKIGSGTDFRLQRSVMLATVSKTAASGPDWEDWLIRRAAIADEHVALLLDCEEQPDAFVCAFEASADAHGGLPDMPREQLVRACLSVTRGVIALATAHLPFRFTAGQVMHDRDRASVLGLFSPEVPQRRVSDPDLAREVTKFVAAAIEWQLAARASDLDEFSRRQWRVALARLVDPAVTPTVAAVESALLAMLQDRALFAAPAGTAGSSTSAAQASEVDARSMQETAATVRVPVDRIRLAERMAMAGDGTSSAAPASEPAAPATRRVFPTSEVEIDTPVAGRRVEPEAGDEATASGGIQYRTSSGRLLIDDFAAPPPLEEAEEWEEDRRPSSARVRWIGAGVAVIALAVIAVGLLVHRAATTSPGTGALLHPTASATHAHKTAKTAPSGGKGAGSAQSGGAPSSHSHSAGHASQLSGSVPTVTGQGSAQAFARLLRGGVAPTAIHVHTVPGGTAGTVVSERRAAGVVTLTVSVPKGDALLPDLIGDSRAQAIEKLLAQGFGYLYYLKSHTGAPGLVYAQQPDPLAVIPSGTKVTIDVSAHY